MVDLINKDYAEFVNLSTNLADLDNAISQLKPPLIKIKGDVELIENEINSGLDKVRNLLIKKRNILEKKLILKHLLGLQENLIYLERNDMTSLRKSFSLSDFFHFSLTLEKTAEIWNMLQHHYKHTAENPNTQALKHRISSCEQKIMETMENNLIDALGEQDNGELVTL